MDESKLTPSEQVMLGIYKAQAGNQMDGELAFMRSKAPFGNWAPSKPPVSTPRSDDGERTNVEIARFHYVPQKTFFDRVVKMLWCGVVWGLIDSIFTSFVWFCFGGSVEDAVHYVVPATILVCALYGFFKRIKLDQYDNDVYDW